MAFKKVEPDKPVDELTPLNVKCTTTKCADQFHCFKASHKSIKKFGKAGVCRDCGADTVDWDRIHKHDPKDAAYTIGMMKTELLRFLYWDRPLDADTREHTRRRGRTKLREHAAAVLQQKIGKAKNFREGYQTPKDGHDVVHFAQHATATCCRKCLEYWHNIPAGTELSQEQLDYCTDWIMRFVETKMPDLPK